jgi:polar amino acid transport system substrate-binding protein
MLSKNYMCLLSTATLMIGVAAFSDGASAACTPKHSFATIDKGKLTVAVSIYAPYSGLSSAGEVEGVDGDIVKKIAEIE